MGIFSTSWHMCVCVCVLLDHYMPWKRKQRKAEVREEIKKKNWSGEKEKNELENRKKLWKEKKMSKKVTQNSK